MAFKFDAKSYEAVTVRGQLIVKERLTETQKWVKRMADAATARESAGTLRSVYLNGQLAVIDGKGHIGSSSCHESDQFSPRIGLAIAYARMIGQDIPEEFKAPRKD